MAFTRKELDNIADGCLRFYGYEAFKRMLQRRGRIHTPLGDAERRAIARYEKKRKWKRKPAEPSGFGVLETLILGRR